MHPVLLVIGASGGLGTSTLAAATAARLDGVLVDGDLHGSGVDATLALETATGLRWPDLTGLDGSVDAARLLRHLPGSRPRVVSAAGPCEIRGEVVGSAVDALRRVVPVVVDLPAACVRLGPWLAHADVVVVHAGLRPRQVRDATQVAAALRRLDIDAFAVTRGTRRDEGVGEAVADHLRLPLADHLEDQPAVVADEGRGRPPRPRGALGRVAGVLTDLALAHVAESELAPLRVAS